MKRGKDIYIGKGLSREEYLSHNARIGEFPALETDRMELLDRLMSVAGRTECYDSDRRETTTLGKVWSNHVLTVLADILHTDTESAGERFIRSIGTSDSTGMETAMRRRAASSQLDRIEQADDAFRARTEAAYHELIRREPERFIVVDAAKLAEEVSRDMTEKVIQRLMEAEA